MSLINEMLKDVEARGGTNKVAGEVRSAAVPTPRTANRGLLFLLGGLVLLLAIMIAWMALNPVEETVAAAAGKAAVNLPVADTKDPAVREPVSVATTAAPETDAAAVPQMSTPLVTTTAPSSAQESSEPLPRVTDPAPAPAVIEEQDATQTLIVRRHEPTPSQKAARASREGFAALRRADWSTAARLLGELVVLEPANDDAREGLVVALANQGRLAEADGVLLDGLAVGVTPARFAKLRARLQASQGRLADALQSLAVAVPPVSEDPEYHALRGALAQQAGDYALALRTYRELVAFAPANGTWQAGLAMALDQAGNPAEALEAYRRAYAAGELEPALLDHVRERLDALTGMSDEES